MSRLLRIGAGSGLLLFCLLLPAIIWAAGGRIGDLSVVKGEGVVKVSARLQSKFPDEVIDEIRRGVPKDLFYTVTLNRRHRRWFDEELSASTVRYTIKFDTLEGQYHIDRKGLDGEVLESRVVPTFVSAVEHMSRVDGVVLEVPPASKRGSTHYVRVKAEMRSARLPLYLDYVLFFIPILEFETPWARSGLLEQQP